MRKFQTLVLSLLVLTSCHAQQVDLSLKLESGKIYKQIMDAEATIIQEFNGQKINLIMTVKGTMSYLVKTVNDSYYDMEVRYESLSMTMKIPQATMEFNSEKNDIQDIFSRILASMKNKPFNIKMTKHGKISEVKNIDRLIEKVILEFPQVPESQRIQLKAQLTKAYGEEAFKGNIEMGTAIFPEKPVSKGDSWIIKTKLESGMSADMTSTYNFVEKTPEFYLITGDSKIKTADKESFLESNGVKMKYDLTGTMTSKIKIDKNTGWIIEAMINQNIAGDAFMMENPQMPNGMKIPISMLNNMIIKNK